MNIGDWITRWAERRPDKTAVVFEETPLSYKKVNERVNRAARLLLRMGVKKGDRVGLLLYNCNQYLELFFALSKIGGILVPLNYRLMPRELDYILNDSGCETLVFDMEFVDRIEALKGRVPIKEGRFIRMGGTESPGSDRYPEYEALIGPEAALEPETAEPVGDGDVHIIMYTSGTTGFPKGAMLSHRKTFFNCLNADIYYGLTPDDVLLVARALLHSGGLLVESAPMLYKGGTLIMKRRFRPEDILKAIQKYKVTILEAPATTFKFMLEQTDISKYDLSSVRSYYTGGERVPPSLLRTYCERGIVICQTYGQTETSTVTWLPRAEAVRKLGSVGVPVFHADVRIVDKEGRQVKPGEVGEITVSGPTVMNGYWGKPDLTKETIKDGWLHTGDLARFDEEGYMYVVDREKDMFISGGENVYPAEIEKLYLENPKISQVAVIGIPDEKWGEAGLAFIALNPGETMTEQEAIDTCSGKLAKYKIPRQIRFVEALPMTATEKVMRVKLRQDYLESLSKKG